MEHLTVTPEKVRELQNVEMNRMRWRLWFSFAESKYKQFAYKGSNKPHYANINAFCMKHWGKTIAEMTKDELGKYISLVRKWK